MSLPVHVFFFRGLSTYGQDNAKWSVFDFGPMHKHFAAQLAAQGIQFHPVLGMGVGPLSEVAERAKAYITSHPVWREEGTRVHLLAHSAGGLAARLVLRELERENPGKILSLLTVASPNAGSRLAEICISLPQTHRGSALLLRSFGYDLASKRHFFDELTGERVARLLPGEDSGAAERASIVAWAPRAQWCWPLQLFYRVRAFQDFDLPSDGVVERDTQVFGDVIAELKIDHFRQVGLFGEKHRFDKMCGVIADFFRSVHARS